MITFKDINNLENRNKQLEESNRILQKKILEKVLSENSEIVMLQFKIEQLENENKALKQKLAYLSLVAR